MGSAPREAPKHRRASENSRPRHRGLALAALVVVIAIIGGGARTASPALAAGEPFRAGDIFQSGYGYIKHINPTFWDIGSWTPSDGEGPTSMAFDAGGNLYVSLIAGGVAVITPEGFYGGLVVDDEDAGAIAIDGDGNIFVAVPNATIRKYDPGGSLVDSYTVATGSGSTQATSLAIAGDDCTLFYTNDDTVVRRYNVCTETQLSNLGSGITNAQVVRLTPDGDVLVSDVDVIHLFDAGTGSEIETYGTPSSGVYWRSMAFEPGGEHFWAVNSDDEDFHRFDLATADETIPGSASIGEGGTGNDFVIYTGPDVLPDETISRYVGDLDSNSAQEDSIPFKWGCELRRHHRYGAVVLLFGQAMDQSGQGGTVYGTTIYDQDASFAPISEIEVAVKRFLLGYSNYDPPGDPVQTCQSASEVEAPYLYVVVATSNYGLGEAGPDHTSAEHGEAWAEMVNRIADWIYNEANIGDLVEVAGGIDAEVDWNSADNTLEWASGYDGAASWRYYDVGNASACPEEGTTSTPETCNNPNNDWTQDDVWQMSWGNSLAWPLPQIYLNGGKNARQWQQISLYGVLNEYAAMVFNGSVTQFQACQDIEESEDPCDPDEDNTSEEGFNQLWNTVNGSPLTLSYIGWRTDLTNAVTWPSAPPTH